MVLDMQAKEGDPACTIIGQHFATLGKLVCKLASGAQGSPGGGMGNHVGNAENKSNTLGKLRRGPLGAAAAYLLSLGWQAPSLKNWKQTSGQVKPWNFHPGGRQVMLSYRPCRHKSYRIGKEELPSLTSALNWSRVLIGMGRSCPSRGQECRRPCQTLWQGALRAGKDAWCARCEKPCSYKHLMWECDWWADNLQEPSNFPELRAKYPGEALWTFGLNPQPVPRCPAQENLLWEGDWEAVRMAPHEYKWGHGWNSRRRQGPTHATPCVGSSCCQG